MASFSERYPFAYHVLPLFAWPAIVRAGAVLSKLESGVERPSTARVDAALGLAGYVHLYLAPSRASLSQLPILAAQLQPARQAPFPHVVLELETTQLDDEESVVCNWNLAVSRPHVPGVTKGGNWTRGTDPGRIREVWRAFRAMAPTIEAARGIFYDDAEVPLLRGADVRPHMRLLRKAPRGLPELMLADRVNLAAFSRVVAFSDFDAALVGAATGGRVAIDAQPFPGYDTDAIPPELRRQLEESFSAGRGCTRPWAFDAVRPAS